MGITGSLLSVVLSEGNEAEEKAVLRISVDVGRLKVSVWPGEERVLWGILLVTVSRQ